MDVGGGSQRVLVIGNSGSGKSWLSTILGDILAIETVHFDDIHWEPGGYGVARDRQLAIAAVRAAADLRAWVMEGVYGWLAEETLPRATALIWLDLPTDACLANLRRRGVQHGADETSLMDLLAWSADYPHRQTSSSLAGHERIFAAFPRDKRRLLSRAGVDRFIEEVRAFPSSAIEGLAPHRPT